MIGLHTYLKLGILNRPILWNNDEQVYILILEYYLYCDIKFDSPYLFLLRDNEIKF